MLNLTSHKAAPLIDGKPSWHRWLFTGNKDGEPKMEEAIKGYQLFMRHPLLFNLLCWSKGSVTLQTWSLDNYRTEVDTKSWISYFTNQTNLLACWPTVTKLALACPTLIPLFNNSFRGERMRAELIQLGFKAAPAKCLVSGEKRGRQIVLRLDKQREITKIANLFKETRVPLNILDQVVALEGPTGFWAENSGQGEVDSNWILTCYFYLHSPCCKLTKCTCCVSHTFRNNCICFISMCHEGVLQNVISWIVSWQTNRSEP